jgi:hypothetical protein
VTFAPGVTTQNVLVSIAPDSAAEPTENVHRHAVGAVNATIARATARAPSSTTTPAP